MEDYTVFDLETTGLSAFSDGIIEIAALKVRNGEVVDTFQELVNPGVHIPDRIVEITHISDEMVACAPCLKEVLPRFLKFVGSDVLMGYNIDRFDMKFIRHQAKRLLGLPFDAETADVYLMARRKLEGLCSYRLDDVREALGIDGQGAHRALKDCRDSFEVYRRIADKPDIKKERGSGGFVLRISVDFDEEESRQAAEERNRLCQDMLRREEELKGMVPPDFAPVLNPHIPANYKDRWEYVRANPFETFASSIASVTGSSRLVPRMAAESILVRLGAKLKSSTTRDCDFCVALSDGASGKRDAAEKWKGRGSPIRIIGPEEFMRIIEASLRAGVSGSGQPREVDGRESERSISSEELARWRDEFTSLWNMMLADDVIEVAELDMLKAWLEQHRRREGDYAEIFQIIEKVSADGVIDADEAQEVYGAAVDVLKSLKG